MRAVYPLLALLAGCATTGTIPDFSLSASPSDRGTVEAQADRVRGAPVPAVTPTVVIVRVAPQQGFAVFTLDTGQLIGEVGVHIDGRPQLVEGIVLARVGHEILAWNHQGRLLWRTNAESYELTGAARDGARVALSLGGGGVTRRHGILRVVDAETGRTHFERRAEHAFGVPTLVGPDVFVPWDGQNLSVFDIARDAEVMRIRSRDDVYSFAMREGPAVYFGAHAVYRLDAEASLGRRESMPHYQLDTTTLPGSPPLALDGYTALQPGLDARERVRVVWRPDPASAGVAMVNQSVYAVFHRDLFALDAASGAVRWAHVHPRDIAGVTACRGGVVVVDDHGQVSWLAGDNGRPLWRVTLPAEGPQAILSAPIDFAPTPNVEEPVVPLVSSLIEAAGGSDTRLLPAQRFAVHALAAIDSGEATRALVTVLTRRGAGPELRAEAGTALMHRTQGAEAMLEALAVHQSFLLATEAPPVGMLATGLLGANERRAVPLLVSHLFDPATPITDLPPLVGALRQFADPSSLGPLVDFVRLYHADVGLIDPIGGGDPVYERDLGEQEHLNAALEQAVEAIQRMGGTAEHRLLEQVQAEPATPEPLRAAIVRVRAGAPTETQPAAQPTGEMTFATPPPRLSVDAIHDAFEPQRRALLQCLDNAASRPAQVRIQFRYEADGGITQPLVLPATFQSCMAPIVQQVQLPPSNAFRELGTYYLSTAM